LDHYDLLSIMGFSVYVQKSCIIITTLAGSSARSTAIEKPPGLFFVHCQINMSKQLKAAKAASSSKANPLEAIPQLEKACTGSTFNPNSLIPLLVLSRHADPEVVYKAVWALHRVFIKYISDNRVGGIVDSPSRTRGGAEEETEDGVNEGSVKGWVRDRLFEYVEVLGGLLRDTEDALRVRIQRSMRVKLTLVYRLAAAVLPTRSTVILRVQR
jgi:hypothetical protein